MKQRGQQKTHTKQSKSWLNPKILLPLASGLIILGTVAFALQVRTSVNRYAIINDTLASDAKSSVDELTADDVPEQDLTQLTSEMKSNERETSASTQGTAPGMITIIWGRTNWQAANGKGCTNTTGTRTLEQNAQDLKDRGLFGVGGVVVARTAETDRSCFNNYVIQPSWSDLAMLRDTYNWKFISQGMNYANMTLMTTDDQRYNESGATLPILEAHGHANAWGAFNYANNKQDLAAQKVVTKYFAFGRKYGNGFNKRAAAVKFPYIMNTNSVNGGRCNNDKLPCYNMEVVNSRRTTSPAILAQTLSPTADQWGVVQFYRLVEGTYGKMGDAFAWDCSSANWQDRWTSQPELYCRENFLYALDNRTNGATVADPATVANAWGMTLPSAR